MSATGIRELIASGDIRTVFHAVVDLRTREVIGYEALSRFPDEGARPPSAWFAEAAEAGMREQLELAAISTAVRACVPLPATTFLALNCSPSTVAGVDLGAVVAPVPLERLVLDIAEDAAVAEFLEVGDLIESLRTKGVRIALDDTGAGFVSLRHMLGVRPDFIKIGLEITRHIDTQVTNQAFASALCAFADRIGAGTIAEGIETGAELSMLANLGVDAGQGYLFGVPKPAEAFVG
jgi:EAL domain-containing protein (putative c-di-GMP-specific phosphodiesterase class I)